jgi:hypothetical protein
MGVFLMILNSRNSQNSGYAHSRRLRDICLIARPTGEVEERAETETSNRANMSAQPLHLPEFRYMHAKNKNLADFIYDPDIPCKRTLELFLAQVDQDVIADESLREMIQRQLPEGSSEEMIDERMVNLEELLEFTITNWLPRMTKESGNSTSRQDRSCKTANQVLVQASLVEGFKILYSVMIEEKTTEEEGGGKRKRLSRGRELTKDEKEKRKEEKEERCIKKKLKQRIFDIPSLMDAREEHERQGEEHIPRTAQRKSQFVVESDKATCDKIEKTRKKKDIAMKKLLETKELLSGEDLEKAETSISKDLCWKREQRILDSGFARLLVDYVFPTSDQLLMLMTWKEICEPREIFKSDHHKEFALAMLMRFECVREITATPSWTDLRECKELSTLTEQDCIEKAELAGNEILQRWSDVIGKKAKRKVFIDRAIGSSLVRRCLRKLYVSAADEEILSRIYFKVLDLEDHTRETTEITFGEEELRI